MSLPVLGLLVLGFFLIAALVWRSDRLRDRAFREDEVDP